MSFQAPSERYLEDDWGIVTSGVRGERYSLTDAPNHFELLSKSRSEDSCLATVTAIPPRIQAAGLYALPVAYVPRFTEPLYGGHSCTRLPVRNDRPEFPQDFCHKAVPSQQGSHWQRRLELKDTMLDSAVFTTQPKEP